MSETTENLDNATEATEVAKIKSAPKDDNDKIKEGDITSEPKDNGEQENKGQENKGKINNGQSNNGQGNNDQKNNDQGNKGQNNERKILPVEERFNLLNKYVNQLGPFYEAKKATRELYANNNFRKAREDHVTRKERDAKFMSTVPDIKPLIESNAVKPALIFPDDYKPPKLGRGALPELDSRLFAAEAVEHEVYRVSDDMKEKMLKDMEEKMMASCEGVENQAQCVEKMQEKLEAFRSRSLFMRGNGQLAFMNDNEFKAYKNAAEERFRELYEQGALKGPADRNIMSMIKSLFNSFSSSNLMSEFKPIPFGHEAMRFDPGRDIDASGNVIMDQERIEKIKGDIQNEYVEALSAYKQNNPVPDLDKPQDKQQTHQAQQQAQHNNDILKPQKTRQEMIEEHLTNIVAANRVNDFALDVFSGKEPSDEAKNQLKELFEIKKEDPERFNDIIEEAKKMFVRDNPDKEKEAESLFKKMLESETFENFFGAVKNLFSNITSKFKMSGPSMGD